MDNALWDVIRAIPQQVQRQYGTDEQLRMLQAAANKLGLYDAADRLRDQLAIIDEQVAIVEAEEQVKAHDADPSRCTFPCENCASRDRNYLRKHDAAVRGEDWRDVRAARDFGRD